MRYEELSCEHGGDIYTEGVYENKELIDFSSNINPLGVPNSFKFHIDEALKNCERYPDIKYREVIENLKCYLNRDYHTENLNFVVGNGAAEIIDLVLSLFHKLLIVVPSFSEYERSAKKWDADIVYSYLNEDMEYDFEDIKSKINNVNAIILANPNNPCGNIINKEKFLEIVKFCEQKEKLIIIDEAFVEFTKDKSQSFVLEANQYKCIFVIRALTKYFAMPGIRFGYGVTSNMEIIRKIQRLQNPWSVNCFAETAVKYVLKDIEYMENTKIWMEKERAFMIEELNKVEIIERVYNTNSNFVLCKLKNKTAKELYEFCMEKSIVIRRADNFKGLNDKFVRFAIKSRNNNEKLLEVLKNEKHNNIL